MSIADLRDRIHEQTIGARDKRVFLVEGDDDMRAWQIMLDRFCAGWEARWGIAAAGNKRHVVDLLRLEGDWLGLVDRDEWDDATIEDRTRQHPNLLILPRFCLENYLINPAELWPSIPVVKRGQIDGGETAFNHELGHDLLSFIRHGVLWKVITPLWTGLRALGFKEALASLQSLDHARDDDLILETLQEWHRFLEPRRILDEFRQQLARTEAVPADEQLALWIHGKLFWTEKVQPVLNRLLGQASAGQRRQDIFRTMPRPRDLETFFARLSS